MRERGGEEIKCPVSHDALQSKRKALVIAPKGFCSRYNNDPKLSITCSVCSEMILAEQSGTSFFILQVFHMLNVVLGYQRVPWQVCHSFS